MAMDSEQIKQLSRALGGTGLLETHISWVLLTNTYAFKIKKPVKFSFLDFSTLEKRKFFCEEEVRLNRRLAKDVYLGVVRILQRTDGMAIETEKGVANQAKMNNEVVDYAIKMKLLPQEKRMDKLLAEGKVAAGDVEKIGEIVADFHAKIETITDKQYGSAELVRRQIDDLRNHRETINTACGQQFARVVDFVLRQTDAFIDANNSPGHSLFEERQREGRIKDCHGDLHSANIFLLPANAKSNGPTSTAIIFDCIEFSKDFRYIDVASEIAFMAMDLDAFGREDLSEKFINAYIAKTRDSGLKTLLNLYKCYRANVRAKIAAIEYSQHLDQPNQEAKARIEKYLILAEKYAKEL